MTAIRYDVLGIGNAIVDVIARAEDDFLVTQGMQKGAMALIDEARAETIYEAMGPAVESSGGSAANTIVGVGELRRPRRRSSARSRTMSSAASSRTTSAPPASRSTRRRRRTVRRPRAATSW